MGHSRGTIVGMGAALKRPDLFHAYVGIGQVINTRDNERVSFDCGMKVALAQGNTAAVEEMKTIAPYPGDQPITRERIIIARKWALFYGAERVPRRLEVLLPRSAAIARVHWRRCPRCR